MTDSRFCHLPISYHIPPPFAIPIFPSNSFPVPITIPENTDRSIGPPGAGTSSNIQIQWLNAHPRALPNDAPIVPHTFPDHCTDSTYKPPTEPPHPSLSLHLPTPTAPFPLPPSTDTLRTLSSPSVYRYPPSLGSPSAHRHPPSPWLSLRESWREAPERAHRTDSTHGLSAEPPHRFLIRYCIPQPTVCTTPLPLPSGGTSPHGARQGLCADCKHIHKPKFIHPSTDAHQALGSPSGRAGAKRLRGLTAPIPLKNYPQNHCTDSSYETASRHSLSARSLSPSLREVPLPTGRGKGWVRTSNCSNGRDFGDKRGFWGKNGALREKWGFEGKMGGCFDGWIEAAPCGLFCEIGIGIILRSRCWRLGCRGTWRRLRLEALCRGCPWHFR